MFQCLHIKEEKGRHRHIGIHDYGVTGVDEGIHGGVGQCNFEFD